MVQSSGSSLADDVRRHLRDGTASPYTQQRIAASFESVARTLSMATPVNTRSAIDVGCGAGFDTFALADQFDHVVGIDTGSKAIGEAQKIARLAEVQNIEFVAADIGSWRSPIHFDFALCNLMSHNVVSRLKLIECIRRMMAPDGVVVYSDECEGYAPLEIHRAIARRDRQALVDRLRQLLRGFGIGSGFRFFSAGSARPIFERLGFEITFEKQSLWNGVATTDLITARWPKGRVAMIDSDGDADHPDYPRLPADFEAIRVAFAETAAARPREGLKLTHRDALVCRAREDTNRYAPYLFYLVMADRVLSDVCPPDDQGLMVRMGRRLENTASRLPSQLEKLSGKLLGSVGLGAPCRPFEWDEVAGLDRDFISIVRKRAGLGDGIDD